MPKKKKQEILVDKSRTGKEKPWRHKKLMSTYLEEAYKGINASKAQRLSQCAIYLGFRIQEDGRMRLHEMNSCRVRLCPMCSWRRSEKVFGQVKRIVDGMNTEKDYAYIFLTLTLRNCAGDKLNETIDSMMGAWNKLKQYKEFFGSVKGWFRALEVTHNTDEESESYDTYHPHFHCILGVNKTYFQGSGYISQEKWAKYWQKAMRLDYTPIVDVRRVKKKPDRSNPGEISEIGGVAEAAKYTLKDSDLIIPDDWDLTIATVKILDKALENRRLVGFGGKMKEWHKRLDLDDAIDGDLVHIESSVAGDEVMGEVLRYNWQVGYNQYVKE